MSLLTRQHRAALTLNATRGPILYIFFRKTSLSDFDAGGYGVDEETRRRGASWLVSVGGIDS